jgi:hypothetical protein
LNWSALYAACRKKQVELDRADASKAREEFKEPEFAEIFQYRKGNSRKVMMKDAAIAKKYRELRNRPQLCDQE